MTLRPWRDWPLAQKALVAIAMPLLLLIVALGSLYALEGETAAAEAEARRTLTVQAGIQSVHAQVAEAATGVRGYLLTGSESFLTRYLEVREALPQTLDALDRNLRDPLQRKRFERLRPLVAEKLEGLENLRRSGRLLPEPELMARMVSQKALLDELRATIDAMREREQWLVTINSERALAARDRTRQTAAVTAVIGMLAAVAAVWLYASGIIGRVQRLRDDATRLARGDTVQALDRSGDELGQLAASLREASSLLLARAQDAQDARASAEHASRAKTEFLSRTSHELRTPLNAIIGFAHVLSMHRDPETRTAANELLKGGHHLQTLIDELLDLARIESGTPALELEDFALAPLLHESHSLSGDPDRRVRIDCAEDTAVHADPTRVKQVLVNLIGNALKYAPGADPIEIVATAERSGAPRVRIEVRDRGPGISEAQRARLFVPFDRLGAERGLLPGSGLGLALSRRLVEVMGGQLDVAPHGDRGSVFWLELPAASVPRAQASLHRALSDDMTRALQSAPSIKTVLCVEDNAGNRALIEALIARRQGIRLVHAGNGAEALRSVLSAPPDLVLLDVHLPDVDAAELIAPLRADDRDRPIVVLTADALPETRVRLIEAGATEFMTKPIDVPAFQRLLDRWLA